jgi:hypothetical protein
MAGTNQATPPLIRQLRAIATIKPRIWLWNILK